VRINRSTARVLPVNPEGRVLLLLGRDLFRRADQFWLSVGGAVERGESLPQAGVRELREEAGISVDPAELGVPIATTVIEFASFGLLPVTQTQAYFAVAVPDTTVTFAGQGRIERLTMVGHAWLSAEGIAARAERLSDPDLPKLVREAVTAVRLRHIWPGFLVPVNQLLNRVWFAAAKPA
jgi:8-oxo-dGTP pyrophosphatase MutT (NUDIX family)